MNDENTSTGVLMELYAPDPWPHKLARSIINDRLVGDSEPAMLDIVAPLDGLYYLKVIPNGIPKYQNESYVLGYGISKEETNAAFDNDNSFSSPYVKWIDPIAEPLILSDYISAIWDVHDFINFTGYENQSLEIILTPPETGDFDLYLYDEKSAKYINSSEKLGFGADGQEYIRHLLPADKEYYIRIAAKVNNTKPVENENNRGTYKLIFRSNVPPRWRKNGLEYYELSEDSTPLFIEPENLWKDLNQDKLVYLLWNYSIGNWEPRQDELNVISTVDYDNFKIQIINKNIPTNPDETIKITPFKDKFGITELKLGAKDKPANSYSENNVTIHILPVNDPPIINNTLTWRDELGTVVFGNNLISISELNEAQIKIDAYDIDGDDLTYFAEFQDNSTPFSEGFSIDQETGIISFYADYTHIGAYDINFTVIDNGKSPDNLHGTRKVTIMITPFNIDRTPKTYLKTPINGSTIKSTVLTFIWNVSDVDSPFPEIIFSVYLSTDLFKILTLSKDAKVAVISNITQYNPPNPLEDKTTYYWTVIPEDGIFIGTCKSGYYYFKIDSSIEAPEVTLISPIDNIILNYTSVKLQWDIYYLGKKPVFSDVYLGTSPTNLILQTTISSLRYTPYNIFTENTYYWQVVPRAGLAEGTIEGDKSPIWSFSIINYYRPPIVELINPLNNSILKVHNISLKWDVDYKEPGKIEYWVYLSKSIKFNVQPFDIVSKDKYLTVNNLDEAIYYWKVIPYVGNIPGLESKVFSFKIFSKIVQPIVIARVPSPNSTINTTWVELKWSLDYAGPIAKVRYDIYLDNLTNDPIQMRVVKRNYRQLFISYELEDQKTYYWRVIPIIEIEDGIIIGDFNKGVAKFSINTSFRPSDHPRLNITLDRNYLNISSDDTQKIRLKLINEGSIDLQVVINYKVEPDNVLIVILDTSQLILAKSSGEFVELKIKVPEKIGKEIFIITIECKVPEFDLSYKEIITVEVISEAVEEEDTQKAFDLNLSYLFITIVIIILIFIFLFKLIKNRSRNPDADEELIESSGLTSQKAQLPKTTQSNDKISSQIVNPANPVDQEDLTEPKSISPPTPKIATTTNRTTPARLAKPATTTITATTTATTTTPTATPEKTTIVIAVEKID